MNFLQYLHIIDSNGENHYILPWEKQTLNSISVDKIIRGASDAFSTLDWYVTKNYLAADNYHLTGIFDINAKKLDVKNFTFTINCPESRWILIQPEDKRLSLHETRNSDGSAYIDQVQTTCPVYSDKITAQSVVNSDLYVGNYNLNSNATITGGEIENLTIYKSSTVDITDLFNNLTFEYHLSMNHPAPGVNAGCNGEYYTMSFNNKSSLNFMLRSTFYKADSSIIRENRNTVSAYSQLSVIMTGGSDVPLQQIAFISFYVWPIGARESEETALFVKYFNDSDTEIRNSKDPSQVVTISHVRGADV
jgi:hypothetical protein